MGRDQGVSDTGSDDPTLVAWALQTFVQAVAGALSRIDPAQQQSFLDAFLEELQAASRKAPVHLADSVRSIHQGFASDLVYALRDRLKEP